MQAMGRVVGNIYKAIELAFREQLDGFTRCPACSGSGAATNMRSSIRNSISKNSHSLNGRSCWFCEGNGLLPLTVLRRFVPCDLPPIKTERSSSTAPFIKPFIHQISGSTQIKFQPCMGTKWGLFSTLKCPSWLADAQCDAASSVLCDKTMEFQEDVSFRPCPLHTAYRSVVLLISLLSSAISSQCANALASSANHSLGIERVKNDNDGLKDSDAVFQIGKEFGSYCKPHIRKRRNHLREKAVEEAERRARSILMALIPSEPTSGNGCTS